MRYILAVDPGKMTGMCLFSMSIQPVLLESWELDEDSTAEKIRWALAMYPDLEIVCERFTITMQTAKNSQAPYSLEQIGILKQCMRDSNILVSQLHLQTPANAKAMFSNEKLKKLGYWHRGGAGHALDSIRHALLYCVTTGWKPVGLLS